MLTRTNAGVTLAAAVGDESKPSEEEHREGGGLGNTGNRYRAKLRIV